MFSFENLEVYKKARILVKNIYLLQLSFPKEEMYALGSQIRRSATSITSNIAEGSGRDSLKEKIHYIEIAYGSLTEAFSQVLTSQDLGYTDENDVQRLRPQFEEIARMLSGLKKSFLSKQNENTSSSSLSSSTHTLTFNP